jgi:F-type H+-transporting ATPase subunit delta
MENTGELARPYAIAAFKQAQEESKLSQWSDMLASLVTIVRDPTMMGLTANPRVSRSQLAELIIDVGGDAFSNTGQNFVRVLAEYGRLGLVTDIEEIFNQERSALEGRSRVSVTSAYELSEDQVQNIVDAMSERLGTDVNVSVDVDNLLIGGVVIRAGDLVIDASLRGRLGKLALDLN